MNPDLHAQCDRQLNQVLTLQVEQVSKYIAYLQAIKQAITKNDTAQLNDLLFCDQVNPAHIELAQTKQREILIKFGYEATNEGLTTCIMACDHSGQLHALREQLIEKLLELEKSLIVNSLLVHKNQNRVKQSIRIMTGHELSNTPASYSKHGNTEACEETRRTLAQA